MKKLKQVLDTAWRIYALTLIVPVVLTIALFLMAILGMNLKEPFGDLIHSFWIGFYFTGSFLGIAAIRWQITLMIASIILAMNEILE